MKNQVFFYSLFQIHPSLPFFNCKSSLHLIRIF
nr:MAG TPA: hypothetical protein [Caudoviricetes sp.]